MYLIGAGEPGLEVQPWSLCSLCCTETVLSGSAWKTHQCMHAKKKSTSAAVKTETQVRVFLLSECMLYMACLTFTNSVLHVFKFITDSDVVACVFYHAYYLFKLVEALLETRNRCNCSLNRELTRIKWLDWIQSVWEKMAR